MANKTTSDMYKGLDQVKVNKLQAKFDQAPLEQKEAVELTRQEGLRILKGNTISDLPNSPTVTNGNLSMRVIEQFINYTTFDWPLLNDVTYTQVTNGIFDITYRNSLSGDTLSAFSDVTIEDFNGKTLPSARLTWNVDTEYHFKLKIPNPMLNQVFINQGTWSAFFDDFKWAQGRDLGKERLKRFLTTIDGLVVATAAAGKVVPINLTYDSTVSMEEQTRLGYGEFIKQILALKTPSKTTALDNTISGKFTEPIINSYQPSELLIYIDYKYYADLKAYLYSGAYHLEEAKVIDLAMKPVNLPVLAATLGITLANIADAAAIVMSKGKANEKPLYGQFYQYTALTNAATPKAFHILHYYQYWSDYVNPQGHLSVYKLNPTAPTA